MSRSLGFQNSENLLAIVVMEATEAIDAMDAREELRVRGVFVSY
jgi:hypothetical protein